MDLQKLEDQDLMWCLRRMPKALRNLMKANPKKLVVAGGYIRSSIGFEKVNDIDLFMVNVPHGAEKMTAKLHAHSIFEKRSKDKSRIVETDNAVTLITEPYPLQFITRWTFSNVEEILSSFDFSVCQACFYYDDGNGALAEAHRWKSLVSDRFYRDLAARRLIYTNPKRAEDAGGSILRVLKYYQRGYRIPLDSLGSVITRLVRGVDMDSIRRRPESEQEAQMAKVLTGLLREVDPNIDPEHIAHLPSMTTPEEPSEEEDGVQTGNDPKAS